ncbi:hypothetical protein SH467x_003663 [Pirellulaceae bacterium SH467]
MDELPRGRIMGARIERIGHSKYSEPEWIVQGIGPAVFRSHFIALSTGIVLDLFTAEITTSESSKIEMPGETMGIEVGKLIGRTITSLQRDDVLSSLIILDNDIFLRDANDGFYGNPLYAGYLYEYNAEELAQFTDYWTEQPVRTPHGDGGA